MKGKATVARVKKKVWVLKKNGLYGWKRIVVEDTITSKLNLHKPNKTQPVSVTKLNLKYYEC